MTRLRQEEVKACSLVLVAQKQLPAARGRLRAPICGPAAAGARPAGPRLLSGNPLSTDLAFVLLGANLLILSPRWVLPSPVLLTHLPLQALFPSWGPPLSHAGGWWAGPVTGGRWGGALNPREDLGVWNSGLDPDCPSLTQPSALRPRFPGKGDKF